MIRTMVVRMGVYYNICRIYICLEILLNIKVINRIYIIYRIILIVFSVYCYITNNPNQILELLDTFIKVYLKEFQDDCCVYMDPNSQSNHPFPIGSSNTGGSGPPNPNNHNPYVGILGVENLNEGNVDDENRVRSAHRLTCYDSLTNRWVYPESYHTVAPMCYQNNTIRIYDESSISYIYDYRSSNPSEHHCTALYPDGTSCRFNSTPAVMWNIQLHRYNVYLGYNTRPFYFYGEYYKNAFSRSR
jgi:hypothetical protein